jgi:hypothetical protein
MPKIGFKATPHGIGRFIAAVSHAAHLLLRHLH